MNRSFAAPLAPQTNGNRAAAAVKPWERARRGASARRQVGRVVAILTGGRWGRVVAILTGEPVSAQTVSKLSRTLDQLVRQFHQARLEDDWAYLFLDGVSLRVRRPSGHKQVQMLVAYGVRRDGTSRRKRLRRPEARVGSR